MSKNLGKTWWEQWGQQTVDHDYVIINGQKQKPPKAYDKWLNEADDETAEIIKQQRKEKGKRNRKSTAENRAHAEETHARVKHKHKII